MLQSEMEALLKLQKETIESLRQLVDSQRLQLEQLTKNYEEQTSQLNQTIANLNETVDHLKKKLFASSSERTKTDTFPGQMDLFNEAEAAADPSIPEPVLEMAVGGYKRQVRKPKATREEILAGLPIMEVPCMVPDEERDCPYCNTPMEVIGKKVVREELRIIPAKVERIQYVQEVLGCPECKKDGASVIVSAPTPSPLLKHSLASPSTVAYVMYQKYVNSIPLYRQETDWKQLGVRLPRATLAHMLSGARRSCVAHAFAHCPKQRQTGVIVVLIAADEYGQRTVARACVAACDRRVKHTQSMLLSFFVQRNGKRGVRRGHVDQIRTLIGAFDYPARVKIYLLDVARIAHDCYNRVTSGGAFCYAVAKLCALAYHVLDLLLVSGVNRNLKPILHQIAHHTLAHDSNTNKTYFFHLSLSLKSFAAAS